MKKLLIMIMAVCFLAMAGAAVAGMKEAAGIRGTLITKLPGVRKVLPKPPAQLQYYEQAATTLSLLRKLANSVYKSRALSPEEKRERLDNIYMNMINVARTALQKGKIKK